ncbi:MAG: peptidylprolyl isomerase [Rhodoglobus sp.]|nr:peptidylprolyl isomerase [Rhodoglobus sp.]
MAASKSTEREAREARERLRRYNARQAVHENRLARRKRDNVAAVGAIVVIAAAATALQLFYFNGGPGTPVPAPSASAAPPVAEPQNVGNVPAPGFAEGKTYIGSLVLNDIDLGITLDAALAPQAVSSLLADSLTEYYVGKTCHRLVSGTGAGLIQCGSLDGTGATDPTYSFGPIENAPADGIYPAGTIAMARAGGDAYSNGRQFFIVYQDTTLPGDSAGGYTVVGTVTSGLDSLIAQIASAGTVDGSSDGAPLIATTITSFTIQ